MKQENGTVLYLAHRNVWVGYWNGKIQCSKKTESACKEFLQAKFSGLGALINVPVKRTKVVSVASLMPRHAAQIDLGGTKNTLLSQVDAEWTKAKALFPAIKDIPTPSVQFYNRGKVAGKAWRGLNKVAFNTVLAAENPDDFIDTVKHELAHLVVYVMRPWAKAHGPEFKRTLIVMGGTGKRCHQYDVSNVSRKRMKYEYKCACQTHAMTPVRHRKAQLGVTYSCRKCKTKVAYTGQTVFA